MHTGYDVEEDASRSHVSALAAACWARNWELRCAVGGHSVPFAQRISAPVAVHGLQTVGRWMAILRPWCGSFFLWSAHIARIGTSRRSSNAEWT